MIADTLRQFFTEHGIPGPIVVAASGGGDSTALLVALAELGTLEIRAAHVNHQLRGADSDADEAFVRDLCSDYDIALRVEAGPLDRNTVKRLGVEAAARHVRYELLQQIRQHMAATHIATAHQKNDQAETVLMRLFSGTGLAGLRGIQPVRRDGVIRPLLDVRRSDIDAFLRSRDITPRIDRSNDDQRFLRNRVRSVLAGFDAAVVDHLAAVALQAREQWATAERAIDAADSSITTGNETRFSEWPADAWMRRAILHRHIRRLDPEARNVSSADLDRLAGSMESLKRVHVTATLEIIRRGNTVILRKRPQPAAGFDFDIRPGERKPLPGSRTIELRTANCEPQTAQRFQLHRGAQPAFGVRNRRDGDRFQPLGMSRQKKLKDFLIDRKIPAEVRDSIPLLIWNGSIVWVGGVEISEEFKLKE